ncbi:MAG: RDD family protein [Akkermansia sp.]
MDIYWIKDKQRRGPATVPDILSLVQSGELTPDTLGWHAGCTGWQPLRELPALCDFLREPEPEPEESQPEAEDTPLEPEAAAAPPAEEAPQALRVMVPGPAPRALARLVDMALYAAIFLLGCYLLCVPFSPLLLPGSPVFWLPYLPYEALLIRLWGTTPGKALFGIRIACVRPEGIRPPSWGQAVLRALLVFACGLGMMLSFLPLIMGAMTWWQIRERGVALWDARLGLLPMLLRPVSAARLLSGVLLLLVCVQVISQSMSPWVEPMLDMISAESPELGESLRRLTRP